MKKSLVIIKLGGSVITDKASHKPIFRKKEVKRLVGEIVAAMKKKNFDLILVHGAGSFGHPVAKRYNIHKGYLGKESSRGFALTKKALSDLNQLFWQECLSGGLVSCVVEPSAVIESANGKIQKFDTAFIENLVRKAIVPILFGDAVFDSKMGFSICSGDAIVSYLARKFKASKVIFVSDVEGVYDKSPKLFKDAKLIPEVNEENFEGVLKSMVVHNKNDVSGEMRGKIIAAKNDLGGFKVRIINGLSPRTLEAVLGGNRVGTSILFNKL